ncbi:MAG: hypothetical protein RIR62_2868 [Pseudomonadota bacterium]
MLVFWEQRLAILATPKTGSTAIEAALDSMAEIAIQRPPALKHTSVRDYHRHLGPYLQAASGTPFTLVALMREPKSWLGSWYRTRQRDDVAGLPDSTQGISFDRFVNDWCDAPQPAHAAVGSQSAFLAPLDGRGADHLFRYEEIGRFTDFLEDRLGHEIILPRLNVSPDANLDLSPATEARLRAAAAADYALYDSLGR